MSSEFYIIKWVSSLSTPKSIFYFYLSNKVRVFLDVSPTFLQHIV